MDRVGIRFECVFGERAKLPVFVSEAKALRSRVTSEAPRTWLFFWASGFDVMINYSPPSRQSLLPSDELHFVIHYSDLESFDSIAFLA